MNGTEKQVKWAEDILKQKTADAKAAVIERAPESMQEAALKQVTDLYETQTEAVWWIDRRSYSWRQIAVEISDS